MADVNMEGFANGHGSTNGVAKTNNNPVSNVEKVVNGEHKSSGTITNGVSNVELSHLTMKQDLQLRPIEVTRKYRGELASMNRDAISHTESVECFLDFVAADRLRRIPHKGSRWDKILRLSEYFTTQVSLYHESVGQFVPNSQESAQLIWACCRILIQMGPQHTDGLDKIMGVFYKMGLTMSSILRNRQFFYANDATQHQLSIAYSKLVSVVVEMTINYVKKGKATSCLTADDIEITFGRKIDSFFHHRDQVSNTIWTYRLEQCTDSRNIIVDISTIRDWLCPQDRILRLLVSDTMNVRSARDDFTCEWFQPHLIDFSQSSDHTLLITGGAGCGKSVLSGWITERLERQLRGKSYIVNSIIVDPTLEGEAVSLSIVKRLLLQSLEQNVGNVKFYKCLADAVEMTTRANNVAEIEETLWSALATSLDTDESNMIIIDGLDHIVGGEVKSVEFLSRLNKVSNTKVIVLSKSLSKPLKFSVREFSIKPNLIHHDLCRFVKRSLASYHHFHDRKEEEKQTIVHRIVESVKGDFVMADLIIELLREEKTHDGFTHALKHMPKSTTEAMEKLIATLKLTASETKLIISWLLVSKRPLSLLEIQSLLEVDVKSNQRSRRLKFDVEQQIRASFGSLVDIRDGIVCFRHATVLGYLSEQSRTGKHWVKLHDAHRDLTQRCLAYTNTHVATNAECTTDILEATKIDQLFQQHHLLEYSTRYWTTHFRASSMYQRNGKHEITSEFRSSFSTSVLLAQIERSCWGSQTSIFESLEMHQLALSLRKLVLTETHESVLQCLISIASSYEETSKTIEASHYYYQATTLSRKILGAYHAITITCAESYITCVRSEVTTKRTETVTRKEELFQLVIAAHGHNHGHTSKEVIGFKKLLAKLYMEIQEVTLATKFYREAYDACVEHYGKFHSETMTVSWEFTGVLQRASRHDEVLVYIRSLFETAEDTMDVCDSRRITITFRLVEIYESRKNFIEAEELLVTLWRRIAIACHSRQIIEVHERKIEVTLAYIRFLRRQSRYQEAENILRGLWIEYESLDIQTEGLIIWIKMIGEDLNELRILDVAIKVFTSVWKYYKKIGKQYCVEAISVAITLAKITVEIRSEESYTEVTTYTEEEILREVYESTIKTITTTTITTTTVETCKTLSAFYVRTERWSEALTVCHELLKGLWLSIISGDGTIELPRDFTSEAVEMAIRRAHCHVHVHQNEKAEKTLLYIFRATKTHLRIQDELVIKATRELINFYERINRWDRIIEINREIWEAYSRTLGKTHHMTLEILYHLGELSIKHGGKDAEKYYLEIYLNLDRGSDTCHQRAIEAALALTKIYEVEKRWTDAKIIYSRLWLTIVKYTKEYGITAERVDEVYRRYFFILEELKVSYTILRQTTIEFRETCIHTYGAGSEITLKATIRLAEINERSEEHVHESIQMYEKIFHETKTTTKTTTITTMITEAKSRLTRLYVKHSSTSTEYTSKAVSLFMEKFETTKSFYGCSHELTIKQLEELAVFYKSRSDQKLTTTVLRILQSTVIEIISEEKDSKRLFDSSIAIAKIYLAHGHTHEANDLLVELRRQIVTRDTRNSERCGFKFNQNIDRRSFVFIATFEETLKGTKTINFSEIMAEFLSETILYEAFTRSLTQKSRFEVTMAHGARLRYFRRSTYHDGDSKIDDELFEAFQKNMGASIKTSKTTTRYFFSILLEESGKSRREVSLVKIGCGSGAAAVRILLEQSKFQEAIDLATCILHFTQSQEGYHDQDNISNSFKIALYLAGRGAQHCSENDPRHKDLMSLSRTLVKEILEASRHMNVDFSRTPVPELNELVSLIGAHQNFNDLEWILTQLWNSRYTQTWSTQTIVHIGQRLVEVRFNRGDRDAAIHILEDICYNLRRVWGLLDKTTLQMFTLLSELYTAIGRYEKAMFIHEEILRHEVSDDNDMSSVEDASRNARYHLELLKRAYQRLGKWDKPRDTYITLFDEVTSTFQGEELFRDVHPITKWPSKGADDRGTFKPPTNWGFITSEDEKKQHQNWLKRANSAQRYDFVAGKGGKRAPSGLHTYIEHHHNDS